MPGGRSNAEPPPEVPDEFAAAYLEAYERVISAQTGAPRHRQRPAEPVEQPAEHAPGPVPEIDLPERRGRLVVGTHRHEAAVEDTRFDRVRDSPVFVPSLLVTLALLLVLGAYVLGRVFTAAVGGG